MDINYTEIAEKAAQSANRAGITLDFTKDTIKNVDVILGDYNGRLSEYETEEGKNTLWNIAVYYGIYTGETLLRCGLREKGYDWRVDDGLPVLASGKNMCSPITKAHKMILNGPEDSVSSFFDVALYIAERKLDTKRKSEKPDGEGAL